MMRVPEPLERVRAMVCEFCWVKIFDTELFERLGRRERVELVYHIAKDDLQANADSGCQWCSNLQSLIGNPRSPPIKNYTITLGANTGYASISSGSNLYVIRWHSDSDDVCWVNSLHLSTEVDNFAAHLATAREVETDLTPSKTSAQISRWFKECALHKCCPEQLDSPLPTRVIEVATPKIVCTTGAFGKFAALSYCWGIGSQTQLRSHNIEAMTQYLELSNLPQTIKDAVTVTRSLSIPYLWVDALCIIQDDPEDKSREIGSMAKIYSLAHVTILASSAADAADGFLQRRSPDTSPSFQIPFRVSLNSFGSATARTGACHRYWERENNPLSQRVWALQELVMASRLLMYTPYALEWRCAAGVMTLGEGLVMACQHEPMNQLISQLSDCQKQALEQWCITISDYSRRAMTIESDKLPAIAALAERFAPVLGEYYAGIWQYGFVEQLAWKTSYTFNKKPSRRSGIYKAPSWSWASLDDKVHFWTLVKTCCTLVSVESVPKDGHVPYGEVVRATTTLCGKILVGFVTKDQNSRAYSTLTYPSSHAKDPPLKRFYASYFCGGPTEVTEAPIKLSIDDTCHPHSYSCVLLLVLCECYSSGRDRPKSYDRYKSGPGGHIRAFMYAGLILVPAGPGTVRRIGSFEDLHPDEFKDTIDQEITIV